LTKKIAYITIISALDTKINKKVVGPNGYTMRFAAVVELVDTLA